MPAIEEHHLVEHEWKDDWDSDEELKPSGRKSGRNSAFSSKRIQYEPRSSENCRLVVCTQTRAVIIATLLALFVVAIATIAAFSRAPCGEFGQPNLVQKSNNTPTAREDKIPKNFPWKNIRLPKSILPHSYNIFLHPNLTTLLYTGSENITAQTVEHTDKIIFNSKNIDITETLVTVRGKNIKVKEKIDNPVYSQVCLILEKSLKKGDIIVIFLKFNAKLQTGMNGFYRSNYKTPGGQEKSLATTFFEPTHARSAFPCFDEPAMKAKFTLSLVREDKHNCLFNMPKLKTETYGGGLKVDHFTKTVKMSTYLVAFVISDFKSISKDTSKNVKVSVWTPEQYLDQAEFALGVAVKCLEYYEIFFGIPYPLPKQDMVAIPDFAAGAMENWGLITYRLTSFLYKEGSTPDKSKQNIAVTVTHELAHQWFGNLVTMKWWNDLWLNEGFASYVEFLGTNNSLPEFKMMEQFVLDKQNAMSLDSLATSHPISVRVDDPAEINELFDSISYQKGASIIRMLQGFVGDEALHKGLKNYLSKYKYSNAVTEDLWNSISSATDGKIDVSKIMKTWTMQMGYPYITLTRKGNEVTAVQNRYLKGPTDSDKDKPNSEYKWYVPLTYYTDTERKEKLIWMEKGPAEFKIDANAEWYIANKDSINYYRVNYDTENWNAIITQLKSDHKAFSVSDRAGIINDAGFLAIPGLISQATYFDLISYLKKEEDYPPWYAALNRLETISDLLYEDKSYEDLKTFIIDLIMPVLEKVGLEDKPKDTIMNKYLRSIIVKCAADMGFHKTIVKLKEMFHDMVEKNKTVSENLKLAVLSTAGKYGDEKDFNELWNSYIKSNVPSEKILYLVACTKSQRPRLLNKLLEWSLDETKVRQGDAQTVLYGVAQNQDGKHLAWRFLRKNWEKYLEMYGGGSFDMSGIVKITPSYLLSDFDYEEVKEFFDTHNAQSGERSKSQSLESLRININWIKNNAKEVGDWLKKHVHSIKTF